MRWRQLGVSDEITPTSRVAAQRILAVSAELLEQPRAKGPMRNAPIGFVVAIMNSLAEATMDYVVLDPTNSKKHCEVGFDTPWRVMA